MSGLAARVAVLEQSMVETLLPHVAEVLVKINKEKPADPLREMVEFLEERGRALEAKAESEARGRFDAILAQAMAHYQVAPS